MRVYVEPSAASLKEDVNQSIFHLYHSFSEMSIGGRINYANNSALSTDMNHINRKITKMLSLNDGHVRNCSGRGV